MSKLSMLKSASIPHSSRKPSHEHHREFHVSRAVRDQYQFDQSVFETDGNVVFANFDAARRFAEALNTRRPAGQQVRPGQLNAMGLIDEVLHLVVAQYREQVNPGVMLDALAALETNLGGPALTTLLREFCTQFPPVAVYQQQETLDEYLTSPLNQANALEEMLMLWLANNNPAFVKPFGELFDDAALLRNTAYRAAVAQLQTFFAAQPQFPGEAKTLIELLREPALASPDSLEDQLEWISARFERVSGLTVVIRQMGTRVLISRDLIREEQRPFAGGLGGVGAPGGRPGFVDFTPAKGSIPVPDYRSAPGVYMPEYEAFTPDRDWMPRCVLIAKTTYVWLGQLSQKYGRDISRLDQIPDEELDFLRDAGVTGLWLIGLWERSIASRRIKQMMGQTDTVASAYSLLDYQIAADLGGEEACRELAARAWTRGIRLASDMVPNHMGIDSYWVINHPEYFLSLDYSPYPGYTFNGPDLSHDPRIGIFLEDHYYNHTDAAVVFKRVDNWTGEVKYLYHGNDGTSTPWNDTAQLDYLNGNVREAVIQTIFHIARQFPIIRFDAAMTLAKKHIKRLWFPDPGAGDGIPSRAAFGMTADEFDKLMPNEFWREVVDRAAVEIPDTLLMAEAFWLMEGYFVRTLGMHRVYNSAFMHMMRDEDNAKYRQLIKNTIEFDPEILKRYVNFMTNHDEKTAREQFDTGDKYFGVCVLMATLPGMPMYGHGQFEGFGEKYGVEYRRAKWDETPNEWLIDRHRREIFPLLHRRYLFADVDQFLLYDFWNADGDTSTPVNEDVIAYSNGFNSYRGDERALVVYHNRFATARGWVRTSAATLDKTSGQLVQKMLGDGLRLHNAPGYFTILRDQISGLEFIRNSQEMCERGLYIEVEAYKCQVFIDIREVVDVDGHYADLAARLQGRGVPNIEVAVAEFRFVAVHEAFRQLVNPQVFEQLLDAVQSPVSVIEDTATSVTSTTSGEAVVDDLALPANVDEAVAPRNADDGTHVILVDEAGDYVALDLYSTTTEPTEVIQVAESSSSRMDLEAVAAEISPEGDQLVVPEILPDATTPTEADGAVPSEALWPALDEKIAALLRAVGEQINSQVDQAGIGNAIHEDLEAVLALPTFADVLRAPTGPTHAPTAQRLKRALDYFNTHITDDPNTWYGLFAWALTHRLGELAVQAAAVDDSLVGEVSEGDAARNSSRWLNEWLLARLTTETYQQLGLDDWDARRLMALTQLLVQSDAGALQTNAELLNTAEARLLLKINTYNGVTYFNQEAFEEMVANLFLTDVVRDGMRTAGIAVMEPAQRQRALLNAYYRAEQRLRNMEQSNFNFDQLLQL